MLYASNKKIATERFLIDDFHEQGGEEWCVMRDLKMYFQNSVYEHISVQQK